ncbi:MBL fold metallo-hydrolase [Solibacillus sp. FSL K6-1523]|uniref:MBL fold metallo-hydrolase n=1 Tax=Solibacillus sp. FSL K6-1523 TaxID=2921471 RepID=UPI0030FCFFEF
MQTVYISEEKQVYPIIFEMNYGQLSSINCYLYKHGSKLTLIDAGLDIPEYRNFFEAQLAAYGFQIGDIDQILLTHHHEDHIGLVNYIIQQHQIPVYAYTLALPRLYFTEEYQIQKKTFFERLYKQYGCEEVAQQRLLKMQQTMKNSNQLKIKGTITALDHHDMLDDLQVIAVPGHSPDSIMFYDQQAKWLFVGDLVMYKGTTNALIDHDDEGQLLPTVMQYKNSLELCLKYDVRTVFAGHQQVFSDLPEIIQKNLARIEYKLNRLTKKVTEGNETILQLASAIYGERINKEMTLILSEIIGYTMYAERMGEVKRVVEKTGLHFYR